MRQRMRRGVLAGWLLAAVFGWQWAGAQVATTTVQDTVTDGSGAAAAGTVVVSWGAFTTAAGSSVAAGSLTTTLGAGGALNVALQPNAGATPMGSYYTAIYHLSDGTASREFWVVPVAVPGGGPARLAGIRNQVLPTSMAMQTVSKQYVDAAIAKGMAGVAPGGIVPYLATAGGTMSGPLTLPADPALALQAADKHYVDAAVAAATLGNASGDLAGIFPSPTVQAVHATSGTLDGVAVGQTNPAPVAGTVGIFKGSFTGSPLVTGGNGTGCNAGGQSVFLGCQPYTLTTGSHLFVDASPLTGTAGQGYASFYAAATITGPADHFNGYQSRQTALAGANITTGMTGYESQQIVQAGGAAATVSDFHAEQNTGTGTITNHYGFNCDVFTAATGRNYCLWSPYGSAWIGKVVELGGDTGGDNGTAARFHKGSSAQFYKPDDTSANTIFTDGNGVLNIAGQNGGVVALSTGSFIGVCPPGTNSYSCNAATIGVNGLFHETLMTPASSGASCSAGDFTDDANFHYVCVAANTWKRVALSSF